MDEDTYFAAGDGEDSENITSAEKPSHTVGDSRDEFLDSLIEAELNNSTNVNTDHSAEMLVENSVELLTDLANETENVNENHELNEEMAVTDTDVTDLNTDGPETEPLPDSIPNDDKFVKPKEMLCHFPLGRIKRIVKADPEVPVIGAESLFLISKATELFLRWLGKEVHGYTLQKKKKTIQLRDLNSAIAEHPALEFLDGALE